MVLGIVGGVGIASALALSAFRQNVTFYFVPTQVAAGQAPVEQRFRLGGMVSNGSVQRSPGSLDVHFTVTDCQREVPVTYTGVLPDLFREGQGVIAHGRLTRNGVFVADEVLAKHDEKYMPPNMAQSMKDGRGCGLSQAQGPGRVPGSPPPTALRSPAGS
jgi:cytochrome c-type biogenesis protein CcmE